ncbi:MAG: histidinol-phosphate transaminase [Acidimicrobiia bacterium]
MTTPIPPRPDVAELSGYHSPQIDVPVRLNTNESPLAPPVEFVDAWLARLREVDLNRYPDRAATELRDGIGAMYQRLGAQIFAANGANEVLQTILLTYGGHGRKALLFEPTYAPHAHYIRITGTTLVEAGRGSDFAIDFDAARMVIEREQPEIVFVCRPNNPTGTVEPLALIESLLAVVPGLLVVDEAYGEFAPDSAIDLVRNDRPLVVTRTYSKVWSLAAQRLGYCIAPEWAIAELEKVVLPYHLSAATQLAGVEALRFSDAMRARVGLLVSERERVFAELQATDGVTAYPSGANFILIRSEPPSPERGRALWQSLLARGVLVRDFSHWPHVEGCLRVTIGTADENDAFIVALRASL